MKAKTGCIFVEINQGSVMVIKIPKNHCHFDDRTPGEMIEFSDFIFGSI